MEFERLIKYNGHSIGILDGADTNCIFIKTGAGGSVYGYENRYLRLAYWLRNKFVSSVAVMDTPMNMPLEQDFSVAMDFIQKQNYNEVFYLGISRGAQEAATYAYRYPTISKMLLINMPMMINWHKSRSGLNQLQPYQHCTLVCGDNDPSYSYIPFAKLLENDHITVHVENDLGHHLPSDNEMLQTLISLYWDNM